MTNLDKEKKSKLDFLNKGVTAFKDNLEKQPNFIERLKESTKKQVKRVPASPATEIKNESAPVPTTAPSTVVPSTQIPAKSEKTKKTEMQSVPAENKVKAVGNGKN